LRWPEPSRKTCLVDPCAGDGTAILTLRKLWVESYCPDSASPAGPWSKQMGIRACELEAERARALDEALEYSVDRAYHADAFRLCSTGPADAGATVLFLNPPYDHDPELGRLEHRFLLRFAPHLHPGAGFLFYLVPHYALAPSAEFLARHFLEIRAWRLPEPEFQAFRQILLVGRRAGRPLASAPFAPKILEWSRDAACLPVLPEVCPDPYVVDTEEADFELNYAIAPYDLTAAVEAFQPWKDAPLGVSLSARELLGQRFETAMPPKPVHIALALSSGMFNGHRLEPNDPGRHPPLLAKGIFDREFVEVSERRNSEGDVVATVEIEQPSLSLTVLRLDNYTFHRLASGTIPVGGDDVSLWNAADLIVNYDRSLARLLRHQFPALHDPQRPDHQIALPPLARKPYRAQAEAVQAALKLIARGFNPFLVAEVGTGKSTMALTIAAALSPAHHAKTTEELRRQGLPSRVPCVKKTLILCPPHLLQSWSHQAAAVLPDCAVRIVTGPRDLEEPAQIYILSRETAKLGFQYGGLEGRCGGCGAPVETSPDVNASHRLHCEAVKRRPRNRSARLAETLATLLAPAYPNQPLVKDLAAPALLRRLSSSDLTGPRTVNDARLIELHESLLREIEVLFREDRPQDRNDLQTMIKLLPPFDAALGTAERVLPWLHALLDGRQALVWGPLVWLESANVATRPCF
jgi:hypothetical protein